MRPPKTSAKANNDNGPSKYAQLVHKALNLEKSVDEFDVIQFQIDSKPVQVGSGCGERLAVGTSSGKYSEFEQLNGRRVLSNMYEATIPLDGKLYPSAEHAFHAGKALLTGNLDYAHKFTESGEFGSVDPKAVKKYGGKKHLLMSAEALEGWTSGGSTSWMKKVLSARLSHDELFRRVLKASGEALLVHQIRGNCLETQRLSVILHKLRDSLS